LSLEANKKKRKRQKGKQAKTQAAKKQMIAMMAGKN